MNYSAYAFMCMWIHLQLHNCAYVCLYVSDSHMLFILAMQLSPVGGNETFLPEDHRQALSLTIHILISIIPPFQEGGEGERENMRDSKRERGRREEENEKKEGARTKKANEKQCKREM